MAEKNETAVAEKKKPQRKEFPILESFPITEEFRDRVAAAVKMDKMPSKASWYRKVLTEYMDCNGM